MQNIVPLHLIVHTYYTVTWAASMCVTSYREQHDARHILTCSRVDQHTDYCTAEITCPPKTFTDISITPCNYNELKGAQTNRMVQLPDEYYLRVVVRHGTPELCVLRGSFTSTSYTLHIVSSVKEGPLCSPEQRLNCLSSTHDRYNGIDYFGVLVWRQQNSSVHYLIVNGNAELILQEELTHASFNLQHLWYGALPCESITDKLKVVIIIPLLIIFLIFRLLMDSIVYCRIRLDWRTVLQDRTNTAIDISW